MRIPRFTLAWLCTVAISAPAAHAQLSLLPTVDTFLSSPRPDGTGDGQRTCCDGNPVPFEELISSHNVMEVDTNQGGGGPVEPLMYFDMSEEIEAGRGTLLERFAATPGASATLQVAIVNGFDPLTMRRITSDWITIEGGGNEIGRSNFPGAPSDLATSAFVPGGNIETESLTVPNPAIPNQAQGVVQVDVTQDLIAWAAGADNFGWAFSPGASQGGTIVASENEDLPEGLLNRIEKTMADLPDLRPQLILETPDGRPPKPTAFIADFDRNGAVEFADFLTIANNLYVGTTFEEGDNNSDGIVDLHDFVEFRAAFNAGSTAAAASVPEPSTCHLFVLALACVFGLRNGRNTKRCQ